MKTGFQIKIQKNLSEEELISARNFLDNWIKQTLNHPKGSYGGDSKTGGGRNSFYRRGTYGFRFDQNLRLVFRRISHSKRIFAVVKSDELVDNNGKSFGDKCYCPRCSGGLKAKWKNGEPEMEIYISHGDIKG